MCVIVCYFTNAGADLDIDGVVLIGNISTLYYCIQVFLLQVRFAPHFIVRFILCISTAGSWQIKHNRMQDGYESEVMCSKVAGLILGNIAIFAAAEVVLYMQMRT